MRVLAIDPATRCGWAWSDGYSIEYGHWNLKHKNPEHELLRLFTELGNLGAVYGVDVITFERPIPVRGMATTQKHGEKIAILKLFAAMNGVTIHGGFVATSIKKHATGNGRAEKEDMIAACRAIGLDPKTDDEADAIWILKAYQSGYQSAKKTRKKKAK